MPTTTVALYSKAYLGEDDGRWSATPSGGLLHWLEGTTSRWIARIGDIRIALGSPEIGERRLRNLWIPQWILEASGLSGDGEEILVHFEECEKYPKASKISLQVLGEIPEGIDMVELLEEPLSQLGMLSAGQILPTPVLEGIPILVQAVEPEGAEAVFLDGPEVALEIESDVAERPMVAPAEPPQPLSLPLSQPQPLSLPLSLPLPLSTAFDEEASMVPSLPLPTPSRGFVPFSGVGRRLGGP